MVSVLVDSGGCAQVATEVPVLQREAPQVFRWGPGPQVSEDQGPARLFSRLVRVAEGVSSAD